MLVAKLYFPFLMLWALIAKTQNCQELYINDSLFRPAEHKKVVATLINVPLKNGGNMQFIDNAGKYTLKIQLNEKQGLNELGPLEIKSGNRSYFVKNATLYDINETEAYFLLDVLINYIATLKDDGISTIIFNTKFEVKLSKEDSNKIKKAAKCFYETHKK